MKTNLIKNELVNNFDKFGRYVLEDYDHQRPFSSFLPGIAGLQGIPMWVFYVNRGQGVCSFGVENKDHPILEFQAANKAYQSTASTGFRTFLNGFRAGEQWHREVFSPWDAQDVVRTMSIGMNEVEVQEINHRLGYQVNVLYFLLPNLPFSALVRRVSFKNLQDSPIKLEVLDGLPGIVPYGVDNGALKNISRTIEAWMQVDNLENKLPFYQLKATPGDVAEVHAIEAGNYALAFGDDGFLSAVADPTVIFGLDTSHAKAHLFHAEGLQAVLDSTQVLEGRTLCAFFGGSITLNPGEVQTITSLYGYSRSLANIQTRVGGLCAPGYIDQKLLEARKLTDDLTQSMQTESAAPYFDGYCRQTFLDNVLRGGFPLVLGDERVTHVYSRKHGDIERDYNYFVIPPETYSQGNGNFRDVNQNRRNDVFFVPQAGEFNLRFFMSLIQADGYNPLVINGLTFSVPKEKRSDLLALASAADELEALLGRKFTPGELFDAAMAAGITIPVEAFLEKVFSQATTHIEAEHGEGYWVDHWTYNLDLIEAYLAVFPDKKRTMLFESEPVPFFDSATVVQPRAERYVLSDGKPRQLNALNKDPEKDTLIQSRHDHPNWARSSQGEGEIFCLPVFSKLALLALIKYATRDPGGMGIQMEAGRPGWYDALNGLPALFGASMPETYELLRLVNFLIDALEEVPQSIPLPVEAQVLLDAVSEAPGRETDAFAQWDQLTSALDTYRASTRLGFDGGTIPVRLYVILQAMRTGLESGIAQAASYGDGVPPTYFIYEGTDYDLTGTQDQNGNPHIQVKAFKPVPLPAFLEGPVRLMKIVDRQQAKALAQAVKNSALYDRKLGMFKVNAPLDEQSHAIGRARAFTPGWLENESIWLHMSFKYLLELLKAGLFDEYFEALHSHLPAFMDPEVYGRSPLENSSFIVSSAHPDTTLHGNGFVARLSGSTAEFLSMWVLMTVGKQPFRLENDQLVLAIEPILPGWLFKEDGTFTFRFLGMCDVTLHNPTRLDTYNEGVKIQSIELYTNGEKISLDGAVIKTPYAESIRRGQFDSIELFYG
jgi:hypothetical protein